MTNGIIIVCKGKDFTSADVVAKMRGICRQRKIGHTGTLDPNATGVLPICLGNATRLCDMLTDQSKEYEAELELGKTSDTQDIWGQILTCSQAWKTLTIEQIRETVSGFQGAYEQMPPMYSAIKQNGVRLYELAREGKEVERASRTVTIYQITILKMELPYIRLRASCSKGTYIRTLCHDIGERLGCGAVMTELTRTRTGGFTLQDAHTLDELQTLRDTDRLQEVILPVDSCFQDYPALQITEDADAIKKLSNGNQLEWKMVTGSPAADGMYRVYDRADQFCGIYRDTVKYKDDHGAQTAAHHVLTPWKMFLDRTE